MYLLGDRNTINLQKLTESVGRGGKNLPLDVLVVQRLINGCKKKFAGKAALKPDGLCGNGTIRQIIAFQKEVVGYKNADGRVDPNGHTHKALLENLSGAYVNAQKLASLKNQKEAISVQHFASLLKKQFSHARHMSDMEKLLTSIQADNKVTDTRWVAYMLATVRWECAGTWKPIEEYGKGQGRSYGTAQQVLDPAKGKTLNNTYYGRGYVQLTWAKNYKLLGKAIGLGDQLYIHPELALKSDIAYEVMSVGMREGLFSGRRLAQYLAGTNTDYVGARTIINGYDHASDIAALAVAYEAMLKASVIVFDPIPTVLPGGVAYA